MKEEILELLRGNENFVSGQELCERFQVSRTAIWKNIKKLEEEGYMIEAVRNKGYRLCGVPDNISAGEIRSFLHTGWLGKIILYQEEIDSTNAWAKRIAEQDETVHGTVLTTEEQTSGRGRRGRSWVTPPGTAIAMSIVLKPDLMPEKASMLTLVMGLSVVEACRKEFGLDAMIKWPNDAVLSSKKICGILTEMSAQVDYINYIVVGIGINVNITEFPEEIAETATSLYLEKGEKINRSRVIAAVLNAFEENYELFMKTGDCTGIMDKYNAVLVNKDQPVKVLEPGHEYTGIARTINNQGELLVEREDGTIESVYAGEVSVRGIYGYV